MREASGHSYICRYIRLVLGKDTKDMAADSILRVMGCLKVYSSKEHPITTDVVFENLGKDVTKSTIRASLKELFIDLGPNSKSEISKKNYFNSVVHCYRIAKKGAWNAGEFEEIYDENSLPKNVELYYWAENRLTDSMIDLLKASVSSNQFLSKRKAADLIRALDDTKNMRDRLSVTESYVPILDSDELERAKEENTTHKVCISNDKVIENFNILQEAVRKRKKVRFDLCWYNKDIKLEIKPNSGCKKYNPYAVMSMNGLYYLIGSPDEGYGADGIAPADRAGGGYRIDRMANIQIIDEERENYPGNLEQYFKRNAFDAVKYRAEHPAQMWGDVVTACIYCEANLLGTAVDTFGFGIEVEDATPKPIENTDKTVPCFYVHVKASVSGIKMFCKSYSEHCVLVKCFEKPDLPGEINQELLRGTHFNTFVLKQVNKNR